MNKNLPDGYLAGSSELGLHLKKGTSFAADIAIFREGVLNIGFHSVNYSYVPPNVVIAVDIKIDESGFFRTEEEYSNKKTERLLAWGVERAIWVFPATRRVLVADNAQKWELLLKNGFQV